MTASPTTSIEPADEPLDRMILWAVLFILALLWQISNWASALRPEQGHYRDFSQEWLSGRNYWTGRPIYSPQGEAQILHTGYQPERADSMLPWNAHPPVAVLIALPFSAFPYDALAYENAHLAWNIAMLGAFLLAVAIAIKQRDRPMTFRAVLMLLTALLMCSPLLTQTFQGQLNGILVLAVVLAWGADRREQDFLAGAWVGFAAALKVIPAFIFLYWLMQRRWWALVGGGLTFAVLNGIAGLLFGFDSFIAYVQTVIPSVSEYRSSWDNISLTGLWYKLFNPAEERERVLPLYKAPELAVALSMLSQAIVVLLVAYRCYYARTREQRDHAFGLAIIGMLLVSPITWSHYFLYLLVPLAVPSAVPRAWLARLLYWCCVVVLWIPISVTAASAMGWKIVRVWNVERYLHPMATPQQTLGGLAVQTYALALLFTLYWLSFPSASSLTSPPQPAGPTRKSP